VEAVARKYLRHPIFIAIGDSKPPVDVKQQVMWLAAASQKPAQLLQVLSDATPPVLVFCAAAHTCDAVATQLNANGYPCAAVTGSAAAQPLVASFKDGAFKVLCATDSALAASDLGKRSGFNSLWILSSLDCVFVCCVVCNKQPV
jgi:superfamily II DNA/RNA helicase